MDGRVTDTITEAKVGTAAWRAAIDHGFFIIFDLAVGGNYPDGCGCTTPATATSSGASMSVAYVAVYEKGGNTTPRGRAIQTGEVTGVHGDCLDNHGALNAAANPMDVRACDHGGRPALGGLLRPHDPRAGRLPGRRGRRDVQRVRRRLVPVQRHRRAGLDP